MLLRAALLIVWGSTPDKKKYRSCQSLCITCLRGCCSDSVFGSRPLPAWRLHPPQPAAAGNCKELCPKCVLIIFLSFRPLKLEDHPSRDADTLKSNDFLVLHSGSVLNIFVLGCLAPAKETSSPGCPNCAGNHLEQCPTLLWGANF